MYSMKFSGTPAPRRNFGGIFPWERPTELRGAEVRPVEIRPAEMRDYFLVCLSPVIPGCYTFFDFCEMFTVRHGASLSLALIISCRGEDGKISGHRVIWSSGDLKTAFNHFFITNHMCKPSQTSNQPSATMEMTCRARAELCPSPKTAIEAAPIPF